MTTATEATQTNTKPAMSQEDKDKLWESLDPMIKKSLITLNEGVKEHNEDVAVVRTASKEKKSETDTIFELIAKGEYKDQALLKLKNDIDKTEKLLEDLKLKALSRANEIKLKAVDVSEEDAKAALERTKKSSATLRPMIAAIEGMSTLLGHDLTVFVHEMDSTRGLRITPTTSTAGQKRPQYQKIFIVDANGDKEAVEKEVEKNGVKEMKTSTTILALELSKRGGSNFSVNAGEITDQFLKSQNVDDFSKLTAGVEMPWTFSKDVQDSEGKTIGTKKFNLVFVK